MSHLDPRRADNIGASEVPALFSAAWLDEAAAPDDFDPFETRYGLWMRKAGRLPPEDEPAPSRSDRKFWGSVLEAAIARGVEHLTGWTIQPGGFVEHPKVRGMSATTDFLVQADAHDAVLEIKNVDRLIFRKWPERVEPGVWWWKDGEWVEAERQPPFRIKLQCQAQMACTGLPSSIAAPLVGGNEIHLYRIDRHEGVIGRIEREVQEFWRSIEEITPPDPNWQIDAETVAALHGYVRPDSVADLRGNALATDLCRAYDDARKREKEAAKEKKGLGAQIRHLVDAVELGAERALFDGGFALWCGQIEEVWIERHKRAPYRGFLLTQSDKRV